MKVAGKVTDSKTGEALPFANVYVSDKQGNPLTPQKGAQTNMAGKFEIDGVNYNNYVTASYLGYTRKTTKLGICTTMADCVVNYSLAPTAAVLEEVVVTADAPKPDEMAKRTTTPVKSDNMKKIGVYAGTGLAFVLLLVSITQVTKK